MRSTARSAALALLAAAGPAMAADAGGTSPGSVEAVWVEHEISFTYTGFTTHYSCSGLEHKIEYVLRQIGARPGYKVTSSGCLNSGPEWMPHVRIRASLPAEATPERLAQLEQATDRQGLVARAGGRSAGTDAATARFPASWRVVTFEGTPTSDVQDGDCELMEQLVDRLFKPLGIEQAEGSSLNCVPHQVPINAVRMKVRALVPTAPADGPAAGRP